MACYEDYSLETLVWQITNLAQKNRASLSPEAKCEQDKYNIENAPFNLRDLSNAAFQITECECMTREACTYYGESCRAILITSAGSTLGQIRLGFDIPVLIDHKWARVLCFKGIPEGQEKTK